MPDTLRFICTANDVSAKIGLHFLEVLSKAYPPENAHTLRL